MRRRDLFALAGAYALSNRAFASAEPQNQSVPLSSIEGDLTPADLFFVREHFREPTVSLTNWKLRVEGRVERPLTLSVADLLESETKTVEAVLECAGNVEGGSAVSNGEWEGVPIGALLDDAGLQTDAAAVLFVGADRGSLLEGAPVLPYARILPIEKCRNEASLVAIKLNGRLLPRRNGFPARAFFPAWYGMDSVKWLERIVVLGRSESDPDYLASRMDRVYNRVIRDAAGRTQTVRLRELQVKSAIAWPARGNTLPAGKHVVRGFAWSGSGNIRSVEISTDGGRTWSQTHPDAPQKAFGWLRWSCEWKPAPGEYKLMSRATDAAGNRQPLQRDPRRKDGYELNWCPGVPCTVI